MPRKICYPASLMLLRACLGQILLACCIPCFECTVPGRLGAQDPQAGPLPTAPFQEQQEGPLAAADEVLREMSEITLLPVLEPLHKSLRSRDEIRAYMLRKMKEEKSAEELYASEKDMEAFGLLPKGAQLEPLLVNLLTDEIAGLYDPKAREFYIADWIAPEDQRMVMAHELTHALQDQHFHVEKWLEAARPNDDAELARDAVLEGSATAAMVDYTLHSLGRSVWELPEIDPELLLGDMKASPEFTKAPRFIQHSLLFPYTAGLNFIKAALGKKGWQGLPGLFANPPVSSQQILHPELYLRRVMPAEVTLPDVGKILGKEWKRLDENTLGEFGLKEVLQQYLSPEGAATMALTWTGDHYALFEHTATGKLLLVFRLRLATPEDAARFAGRYSEALEMKYAQRRNLFRRPNYFSFDAGSGRVFLRCEGMECLTLEGGDEKTFHQLTKALGWLPDPVQPQKLDGEPMETTFRASPWRHMPR
jgi:hypothetical protein